LDFLRVSVGGSPKFNIEGGSIRRKREYFLGKHTFHLRIQISKISSVWAKCTSCKISSVLRVPNTPKKWGVSSLTSFLKVTFLNLAHDEFQLQIVKR
jgi:hypothetical protein